MAEVLHQKMNTFEGGQPRDAKISQKVGEDVSLHKTRYTNEKRKYASENHLCDPKYQIFNYNDFIQYVLFLASCCISFL